jgi:hypothetical protein
MMRPALVLLAVSLSVSVLAAEGSSPLVEALLRAPVAEAHPASVAGMAPLTGDETIDALDMLLTTRSPLLTAAVRERIVARLANEPKILPQALGALPETAAAAEAAWKAFQALPAQQTGGPEFEAVREWLRRHGPHLRRELAAAAAQAKDDEGYVTGSDDLIAYAHLDWEAAAPIVTRLATGPGPRASALAHALLYEHHRGGDPAAAERERAILRAIAEDRSAAGQARDTAFEALMRTEWKGSVDWYLTQFSDATLLDPADGVFSFSPLDAPVDANPDLWIPRIAPLTLSANRIVRSNAVNLLAAYHLEAARADALTPLLPWLADPEWAQDSSMGRLRLIQTVGRLGLHEAIAGLRWITRNDPDETMRVYAADALLELQAPDGMTDVRAVLSKSEDAMGRHELEQRLIESGVLTDDEIVEMITAYASAISTESGRKQLSEASFGGGPPVSWKLTTGARLASQLPDRDRVAQRLIEAAARPDETGRIIGRIVSTMNVPSVHRSLASALLQDSMLTDAVPIALLLGQRAAAVQSARDLFEAAVTKGGLGRGIAAVVLNDGAAISAILRDGTADERGAALAAARIVRQPLDAAEVLAAAANAKEPAAAALEMMNTAAARAALGKLYPGEARIWGPRSLSDPGHTTFPFFDQWEESLRALLKKRKLDRIDALGRGSYWGGNGEVVVLARTGSSMLILSTDPGSKSKPVPEAMASRIRQVLDELQPAGLEPFDQGSYDGVQYEYVYLTGDGGRRVFMNNPPSDERDPHARLVAVLGSLVED